LALEQILVFSHWPALTKVLDSALDNIQFNGINLNAIFPQPFYSRSQDFSIPGEFQGDNADLVGDAGAPDVENEIEFFAQLPNQRALGALRLKGEPVALGLLGHIYFVGGRVRNNAKRPQFHGLVSNASRFWDFHCNDVRMRVAPLG